MINKCTNPELLPILHQLMKYKNYFNLLKSDAYTYPKIRDCIGTIPHQLKDWFNLFDGGLLFTTNMFSTRESSKDFSQLLTFSEINSIDFKKENNIHPDIVCFAMTNYGNYYCYVKNEKNEYIYEWDSEKSSLIIKWDSFAEWLSDQIDFANSLIQDDLLEPIGE